MTASVTVESPIVLSVSISPKSYVVARRPHLHDSSTVGDTSFASSLLAVSLDVILSLTPTLLALLVFISSSIVGTLLVSSILSTDPEKTFLTL